MNKKSKNGLEKEDQENVQEELRGEEIRGEQGEFLAEREAGARVRIEEKKQAKSDQNDTHLINAAKEDLNEKKNISRF